MNTNIFAMFVGSTININGIEYIINDAHDTRTFLRGADGQFATFSPVQLVSALDTGRAQWVSVLMNTQLVGALNVRGAYSKWPAAHTA